MGSAVPGKIKAGGQSANRFEHLEKKPHKNFTNEFQKKQMMFLPFIEENKLQGIIFGGPGSTKRKLVEKGSLDYRVKDKIMGYVDNTYTDSSGIKEIVDLCEDMLKESELVIEKKEINNFFEKVIKGTSAIYGIDVVISALKENRADKILIFEDLKLDLAKFECLDCEHIFESHSNTENSNKCESKNIEVLENVDAGDYFYELAQKTNTKIVFISNNTSEGLQFINAFGGVGAILRY